MLDRLDTADIRDLPDKLVAAPSSTVTPGAGIVSSVTAACVQTSITTSGTLSKAQCVNSNLTAAYAIQDADRGKLVTRSNAGAMADTIAQAGTAGAFASGWFTNIQNNSADSVPLASSPLQRPPRYFLRRALRPRR